MAIIRTDCGHGVMFLPAGRVGRFPREYELLMPPRGGNAIVVPGPGTLCTGGGRGCSSDMAVRGGERLTRRSAGSDYSNARWEVVLPGRQDARALAEVVK